MRFSKAITGFATIAVLLSIGAPTTAKQLKGDEITKLLVGNTVEFSSPRNSNRGFPGTIHTWIFYESADTRKLKGDFTFVTGNGTEKVNRFEFSTKWRVSKDGKYCTTSRKGEETCKDFDIDGDTVTLTSAYGTQKGKFHKGNPKGL